MCGLVGGWEQNPTANFKCVFQQALKTLRHRGPDDFGSYISSEVGSSLHMGSTRLSILDLSEAGHMPMVSGDSRYVLSFNGEITNYLELRQTLEQIGHSFVSESDTEVLMHSWQQWGIGALDKFEGMFALAIHDRVENELYLARDPFGVKPLFYHHNPEQIFYASEIQALNLLRRQKPQINQQVAFDYIRWGRYDATSQSFFKDVNQVRPGFFIQFDLNRGVLRNTGRFWNPSITSTSTDSFEEAAHSVRELLIDSVKRNLRADVPVGVALSGGLDSSAIASIIRMLSPTVEINTFSFVTPGFEKSEDEWIDYVNQELDCASNLVSPLSAEFSADLDEMILAQGEPFGSTSIYAQFRVFKLAKEAGITVTLDGQGADEIFAGYDGFPAHFARDILSTGNFISAAEFVKEWAKWPGRDKKSLVLSILAGYAPQRLKRIIMPVKLENSNPGLFLDDAITKSRLAQSLVSNLENYNGRSHLKRELRSQLTEDSLPSLLRHADRNSMHFSVESRVPFLDKQLVEYVFSLPENYFVSKSGETKRLLKAALQGIVPEKVLSRRDKVGFETPEALWLQPYIEKHLTDLSSSIQAFDFFHTSGVNKFLDGFTHADSRLVWRVVNLLRWHQLVVK